jgi:single-strand DNA-binding protein
MANGNNVTLVGNITRDPELRFTNTGQATTSFGLAVNRRWQNRQTQEWEEATSFFDIVCWREMAENAAESLSRGSRVLVTGRLEQRSWETGGGRPSAPQGGGAGPATEPPGYGYSEEPF